MELRHLRYFVAVAEELNFTRAAKRLGISQPPLSYQIKQLEKSIGAPLFQRRSRGIELTNSGKLMLEESRIILRQVEQTRINVGRRGRGETGRVNIGAGGGTYFHPLIPEIIRQYRTRYPEIVLSPEESNTSLLTARLLAGAIDIAFVWPPISDTMELAQVPLVDIDTVVAVPTVHALNGSGPVPLSALANETFVLFPRELNPTIYDMIVSAGRSAGFAPIMGAEAPHVASIIPMVAAGLGISIVPRFMSRIHADGVSYVPLQGDAPRAGISLAYRRHERSRAVQNFVTVVRNEKRNTIHS